MADVWDLVLLGAVSNSLRLGKGGCPAPANFRRQVGTWGMRGVSLLSGDTKGTPFKRLITCGASCMVVAW